MNVSVFVLDYDKHFIKMNNSLKIK